jgi:hypothetical protein
MNEFRAFARGSSALAALFGLSLVCGPADAADAEPDISGVYWANQYHAQIPLVGGGELPLTAEGRAAYEANRAGLEDGSIADIARTRCVPDGLPRALATPYPFEIVQAPPGQVLMVHELNHQIRVIALDEPLPSAEELLPYPWFNGHSVGHWEGDTLVIDTIGYNDKTEISGYRHTEALHTVERLTRVADGVEYELTIDDPHVFAAPWKVTRNFRFTDAPQKRIFEFVCENNRDYRVLFGDRK